MTISLILSIVRHVNLTVLVAVKEDVISVSMAILNSKVVVSSAHKLQDLSTELVQDVALEKKALFYLVSTVHKFLTCTLSYFLAVVFCQKDVLKWMKMVSVKSVDKDFIHLMKSYAINVIPVARHVLMLTTASLAQMGIIGKLMMEVYVLNVLKDVLHVLMMSSAHHA